jgi:hypothetical protein
MTEITIDLKNISDVEWEDVHSFDHPDYSDAFISSANYNGREMTDDELERLKDDHPDWCYENLMEYIF